MFALDSRHKNNNDFYVLRLKKSEVNRNLPNTVYIKSYLKRRRHIFRLKNDIFIWRLRKEWV